VFFLSRLLGSSAHPALKWGIAGLLTALGIGLLIWGLVEHNYIIAVRGVLELVIVGYIFFRVRSLRARNQRNNPRNLP
jgi:hypothetical protein